MAVREDLRDLFGLLADWWVRQAAGGQRREHGARPGIKGPLRKRRRQIAKASRRRNRGR